MSRLLSFSPIQRHLKHSSTRAAHTCRLPTIGQRLHFNLSRIEDSLSVDIGCGNQPVAVL